MVHDSDHDLLITLNERTKQMADALEEMRSGFVTKEEFAPVRALVFSAVGLVLISFMGAIVALSYHPLPTP